MSDNTKSPALSPSQPAPEPTGGEGEAIVNRFEAAVVARNRPAASLERSAAKNREYHDARSALFDAFARSLASSPAAPSAPEKGDRLAELEAIVAKLPKTADGVPVVPGVTLYLMPDRAGATAEDMMELQVRDQSDYCWFSTRAAALAPQSPAADGTEGKK